MKGFLTLDELYQQKKAQCKALKARIAKGEPFEVSKEDIEATLKKRESQLEALSAKIKAKAISDEKKLMRAFKSIDADDSGRLGRLELQSALQALQLAMCGNDLCPVAASLVDLFCRPHNGQIGPPTKGK